MSYTAEMCLNSVRDDRIHFILGW